VRTSGIVPLPKMSESNLGGHAVLAIGYDDAKQSFLVQNSWGDVWGDQDPRRLTRPPFSGQV